MRARINALTVGWPILVFGLVILIVGSGQKPVGITGQEFILDSSLSGMVRFGALITLVGFMLTSIGYLRHDEDKI